MGAVILMHGDDAVDACQAEGGSTGVSWTGQGGSEGSFCTVQRIVRSRRDNG